MQYSFDGEYCEMAGGWYFCDDAPRFDALVASN